MTSLPQALEALRAHGEPEAGPNAKIAAELRALADRVEAGDEVALARVQTWNTAMPDGRRWGWPSS